MKLLEQVHQLALDEASKKQVITLLEAMRKETLEQHQALVQSKAAELQAKELKIQALTLELAHLRRIRYGVKNEALSALQQDMFQESWHEDFAAVTAEVDQLTPAAEKTEAPTCRPSTVASASTPD